MSTLRYKILVAPFSFGDLSAKKTRPVLCLTEAIGKYDELVLAYISSKIPSQLLPTDILLSSADNDFRLTKLLYNSAIRLHKLFTLPKDLIIGELGELSPKHIKEVDKKISIVFHL